MHVSSGVSLLHYAVPIFRGLVSICRPYLCLRKKGMQIKDEESLQQQQTNKTDWERGEERLYALKNTHTHTPVRVQ